MHVLPLVREVIRNCCLISVSFSFTHGNCPRSIFRAFTCFIYISIWAPIAAHSVCLLRFVNRASGCRKLSPHNSFVVDSPLLFEFLWKCEYSGWIKRCRGRYESLRTKLKSNYSSSVIFSIDKYDIFIENFD